MQIEKDKLYSVGEAADILRMSIVTIRRRMKDKKLGYLFDGNYKILGKSILEYIESHYRNAEYD